MERIFVYPVIFSTLASVTFALPSFNAVDDLNDSEHLTDEFIQRINDVQDSWTAGHNFPPGTKFSDLNILMGTKRQKAPVIKYLEHHTNEAIPKSFDARKHWPHCKSIREIKNQGHCGSCWAVSSATTMSDRLCISTNGKFNSDISAQQITSCSPGSGCHGGWPYEAWKYFVEHGASTGGGYHSKKGCQPYLVKPCVNRTANYESSDFKENDHPEQCAPTDYVKTPACYSTCYNHLYHRSYRKDLHSGKEVYGVPQNVTQIQLNILRYGPVVADFTVYSDFMAYKSGIYEHLVSQRHGGHAIRILGWGEEKGKQFWIIANQWGKEWGDEGIVKFRRGINECGIEEDVVSGII